MSAFLLHYRRNGTADFDTICEFEVQIDHQKFRMIDYASAGKTWDEASEMEAWLPGKKQ